ncbi:hypothetical protein LQE88_11435 [Acidaminococcus sp. NSJ-142]|uniref:hypothetical protein n=1 Tax=Acidaminococcus hominis TaxID=2897706 RepID=UPI001E3F6448|nr:hypothetical protein [Acidaminococcus hominis]MCD2436586.1 hypothetical protein [Acidaminococcus hominis]
MKRAQGIARSDDNNKNNSLCQKYATAFGAANYTVMGESASPGAVKRKNYSWILVDPASFKERTKTKLDFWSNLASLMIPKIFPVDKKKNVSPETEFVGDSVSGLFLQITFLKIIT